MKDIILLGSTGSVGKNVLDVVRRYPEKFRIKALFSNRNVTSLARQAEEFAPDIVAIGDERLAGELDSKAPVKTGKLYGEKGLERLAAREPADMVFMAISGTAALKPLVSALSAGRRVALASKEPVVSAGKILMELAARNSAMILPVDSEHSAIMQCMSGRKSSEVRTLYVTGSGGPLNHRDEKDFDSLSIEQILDHPKWNMGRKITVDSATLMNKGLEVMEARWLFDIPPEKIKVVIHPEAIIHSMVEFVDGTISAALSCPDMRFPILKALSYPEILESSLPRVDFGMIKKLTFFEPDMKKFPALALAFKVLDSGGTLPAVLNSANEAAVDLFLRGKIKFTDIVRLVEKIIKKHDKIDDPLLEDIIVSEKWAAGEVHASC
ncbi:MAG: 1-deoxy-D-xylulose-5-phosphate reductoisomerase [Candidatus Omnitrophota bacterium]